MTEKIVTGQFLIKLLYHFTSKKFFELETGDSVGSPFCSISPHAEATG